MTTITEPATRGSDTLNAPGWITVPPRCKPSKACSTDQTRPILCHAYLRRHEGDLWLCAANSYIAVAIKVGGEAEEGFVPVGALRLMERGQSAEQISTTAWRVKTPSDGLVTFDITSRVEGASKNYPDFVDLGVWDRKEGSPLAEVGIDPGLMKQIGDAVGAGEAGCRFEFIGPLKPIRVTPLNDPDGDRVALQMPIRLMR